MSATPDSTTALPTSRGKPGPVRRLYDWVLGWADHTYGPTILFFLAMAESFIFPIPPDALLMPLTLGRPRRAYWFAFLCTMGSVIGGVMGYYIGHALFEQFGRPVLEWYHAMHTFELVGEKYRQNLVLALGTAGFTPVPYKVFTIAGGAFGVPFVPFVVISFVSRGMRFFLVAGLLHRFGQPMKAFIDKYFNILTIAFVALLVGGFLVLRLVMH
ncbi:MAG TPA: YqaA family protein [Gemmatimonadaceae bacterium]|nr:YqaA family protein [Gemmatimonadaceae bacterium]